MNQLIYIRNSLIINERQLIKVVETITIYPHKFIASIKHVYVDPILRILATLEAKTAQISDFWTLCTVILLILNVSKIRMTLHLLHLWTVGQKGVHQLVKRRSIS